MGNTKKTALASLLLATKKAQLMVVLFFCSQHKYLIPLFYIRWRIFEYFCRAISRSKTQNHYKTWRDLKYWLSTPAEPSA